MRVAPIAIRYHRHVVSEDTWDRRLSMLLKAARADASLTHVDECVKNAAEVYVNMLASLIKGRSVLVGPFVLRKIFGFQYAYTSGLAALNYRNIDLVRM